ncbi:hypothetical protein Patl1_35618 [Pistacia atlantica]|nr:hypothetical protein Patl1_35618 [Pistacia atlantica]
MSTPAIDLSDPLFLHPSDHPSMILVPKVLDGTNYVMWKRSMLISLSAKNKLGFIKGTGITPDEKDPKYSLWQHCNAMESQPVASRQQKQWSSTHSKPQGNRKPLHCSYCEGTTHTVDRCYFLNGFPVGHKLHGKDVQPPNQSRKTVAHQASAEVISD